MFDPPQEPPEDPLGAWAVPGVDRPAVPEPVPADLLALEAATEGLICAEGLTDRQLLARTSATFAAVQRLQVMALGYLAQVDARQAFRVDGVASTRRWLGAEQLEVDPRQVALAKGMGRFPGVAGRLLDGRIGPTAARQVQVALGRAEPHLDAEDGLIDGQPGEETLTAVVVGGIRMLVAQARGGFPTGADPVLQGLLTDLPALAADTSRTQLERLEEGFLVLAEHVEAGQLSGCLGLLTDALLPNLLQDRADRQHDRRRLTLVRDPEGAGWTIRGDLDLECGERLWLVLQSELTRDPDAPLDTAQAGELREKGLDPYDPDLPTSTSPRSTGQKHHDAFAHALARYLAADLGGTTGKDAVHIVVTVPLAALDGGAGALPAVTASGTVLPASTAGALACGSAFSRHVLDLRGMVLAASHEQRTLTRAERRAKHTETGGHCQGAGCSRSSRHPGTVLHPHHANPWSRCGRTSLRDTVLLCTSCHHDVHDGRRRLLLKDGRRLGPDGWVDPAAPGQ